MKKYLNICISVLLSSLLLATYSCQDDEWDDHYDENVNRGELQSQLVKELNALGYKKTATQLQKTGLDEIMNSGLTFTMFVLPDSLFSRVESLDVDDMRDLLRNTIFFGADEYDAVLDSDTTMDVKENLSMMNEYIVFSRNDSVNYLLNAHKDTVFLSADAAKINQRIYDGMVHEVSTLFPLVLDTEDFILSLDSAYSQFATKHLVWDSLQTVDGNPELLPAYKDGKVTVVNNRQLKYNFTEHEIASVASRVVNGIKLKEGTDNVIAEGMDMLMSKDLRNKLETLYNTLRSEKTAKYFAEFNPIDEIELQVRQDSIIFPLSMTEVGDSIKFLYFAAAKKENNKYFTFHKDQVEQKKLSNGNSIYLIDSLLATPKYLTLLDKSIIRDTSFNIAKEFTYLDEDKNVRIYEGRYNTFRGEGDYYNNQYALFADPEVQLSRKGYSSVYGKDTTMQFLCFTYNGSAITRANNKKDTTYVVEQYVELSFPAQLFNSQMYKMNLLYSQYKDGPIFKMYYYQGTDTLNMKMISPKSLIAQDGTKSDIPEFVSGTSLFDFQKEYDPAFEITEDPVSGVPLSSSLSVAKNFYRVEFEPFRVNSYNENVNIRFVMTTIPKSKTNRPALVNISFEMIDDDDLNSNN